MQNNNNNCHKTINGFTRQPHPYQVFSIIYYIQLLICISYAVAPLIQEIIQIIFCSVFYSLSLIIFYYAFKASIIDPTDDLVIQAHNGQSNDNDQDIYDYFCSFCDSYVSGNTKHCKVCERCVSDFDHHCKWLNNCIGKKNYIEFLRLLISVTVFGIIFILFTVFVYQDLSSQMAIWLWINAGIIAILFILNFNLMLFHFWLKWQDLTTYQFIIQQRQKRIQKDVEIARPSRFCTSAKLTTNKRQINPQPQEMTANQDDVNRLEVQFQNKTPSKTQIDLQHEQPEEQIQADDVESNQDRPRKDSNHTLNSQQEQQENSNKNDEN